MTDSNRALVEGSLHKVRAADLKWMRSLKVGLEGDAVILAVHGAASAKAYNARIDRILAALVPAQDIEAIKKAAYQEGWNDREGDLLVGAARILPPCSADRLVGAIRAFLADEDAMMEDLMAEGKKLEDFGFPFPRVIEIRSALAAFEAVSPVPAQEVAGLADLVTVVEVVAIPEWRVQIGDVLLCYGEDRADAIQIGERIEAAIRQRLPALSPPSQGVEKPDRENERRVADLLRDAYMRVQTDKAAKGEPVTFQPIWDVINLTPQVLYCLDRMAEFERDCEFEDTLQPHPDVSGLVEALRQIKAEDHDELGQTGPAAVIAHDALVAFQSRQEGK